MRSNDNFRFLSLHRRTHVFTYIRTHRAKAIIAARHCSLPCTSIMHSTWFDVVRYHSYSYVIHVCRKSSLSLTEGIARHRRIARDSTLSTEVDRDSTLADDDQKRKKWRHSRTEASDAKMDLVWIALVLYLFGFVFFAYFCLMADPEESQIAYLLIQKLPNSINNNVTRVIGMKRMEKMNILSEYFLQVMYLVIVLGCWSIIFTYAYPMVTASEHVSNLHKYVGVLVFVACMASFRHASNASPGYITKRTLVKHDVYPYDNLLFPPDRICPTVGIPKLARSKYDRFSQVHVARFDHFCGWLRNPIGEENYRYFLLFLVVHVTMCIYGTVVCSLLFWGEVVDKKLLEVTFFNPATGKEFTADWFVVSQYLFQRHFYVAGVLLLMTIMTFVLGGFLGYHIWLTSRGMTTNESYKWNQVKKWHRQESKRYQQAVKDGLVVSVQNTTGNDPSSVVTDGDVTCTGAASTQNGENESEPPICDPGPMPSNPYDKGVVENWKEVIYPRSLRQDSLDRWRRSLHSAKSSQMSLEGEPSALPPAQPSKPKAS